MKKGFTLVELSIVLVIIGLLVGGVLPRTAKAIDSKVDDGEPDSGGVYSAKGHDITGTDATKCASNSAYWPAPASYVLSDDSTSCRMYFKID